MPGVNPLSPEGISPGIATGGYPQYGVGGGTPGSSAGWKIVVATNDSQKENYANQGYLVWFSSRSAAQNYISSESSAYGSGEIGNFNWASIFERVGLVLLGIVLVGVGVAHATGIDSINPVSLAKKAIK